jgi:hypothetical protein
MVSEDHAFLRPLRSISTQGVEEGKKHIIWLGLLLLSRLFEIDLQPPFPNAPKTLQDCSGKSYLHPSSFRSHRLRRYDGEETPLLSFFFIDSPKNDYLGSQANDLERTSLISTGIILEG